jgi:hypothetical protein
VVGVGFAVLIHCIRVSIIKAGLTKQDFMDWGLVLLGRFRLKRGGQGKGGASRSKEAKALWDHGTGCEWVEEVTI